jgi:biotin synthase
VCRRVWTGVQGGEDPYFTQARVTEIVKEIRKQYPDCAITLSLGEWTKEAYQDFFNAGADRYLLRHETASEELYGKLHPDSDFHERRRCLNDLKDIGYQTGAGFMIGLKGQTHADIVKDLLFLKELQPHMVGIGPFIPHRETPLGAESAGGLEITLILLSIVRLMLPEVLMPATTALGTIDKTGREKGYRAGANVIMPNLTPPAEKSKYLLYEGKGAVDDSPSKCLEDLRRKTVEAGFVLDMQVGDHVSWNRSNKNDNVESKESE